MRRISQRDPKWSSVKIGDSKTDLATAGCLLCSISMLHSKFYPKLTEWIQPPALASGCKFVKQGTDPEPHFLAWTLTDWSKYGLKFIWRSYTYNPVTDMPKIKEYCASKDYGVALCVQTKSGGMHWVACESTSAIGDYSVNDPINGKRLWKVSGFLAPYKKITGYVIFKHE